MRTTLKKRLTTHQRRLRDSMIENGIKPPRGQDERIAHAAAVEALKTFQPEKKEADA